MLNLRRRLSRYHLSYGSGRSGGRRSCPECSDL
jgi:hypothetical protein